MNMKKKFFQGITPTGFKYKISSDVIDDMAFIDLLSDLEDGNIGALSKILLKLLGKKQKEKLYEHCTDKSTGRIPSTKIMEEIKAIMTNPNLKKS